MTDPQPGKVSRRTRWVTLLLRVLGLGLLALVVWKVDWRDVVVLLDGTKVRGTLVGEIPTTWDANARVVLQTPDADPTTFTAADIRKDAATGVPEVDEGLIRIVARSNKWLLLAGLAAFGCVTQIGVVRWWLLLRAQGIHLPYRLAHRLTFIGFFFNNVVPGPTGGDLVKAVYVARKTDKRAQAVVTVVVDRVVGIIALALIAAAVLLFHLDNDQYRWLAVFIGAFLGGTALAGLLFFSRRLRRLLRVEQWSAKLPGGGFIRKADEAVFLWRYHMKAVGVALLLSFANQLCIQGIMYVFSIALHITTDAGASLPFTAYMVVLPVAFIGSAIPMLPGGWGFREAAFVLCFHLVGVGRNPAIALSVLNGMTMLVLGLAGGVYFLLDRSLAAAATPSETSAAGS